jgi:hypothetical protein
MPWMHWGCRPSPADPHLALPPEIAAGRLHAAFKQSEVSHVYLCPLDRADRLPDLPFGPNRVARLTAADLEKLVDWPRLRRVNASWSFDAKLFSNFTWLIVEKTLPDHRPPGQKAIPLLFEPIGRDWQAIAPHRGRFDAAVEDALFALMLAPWEAWVPTGLWRAFEVPWDYTIDDNIFVRPKAPPAADALSWDYMLEDNGGEVFVDPNRVPLKVDGAIVAEWLNDRRWVDLSLWERASFFRLRLSISSSSRFSKNLQTNSSRISRQSRPLYSSRKREAA